LPLALCDLVITICWTFEKKNILISCAWHDCILSRPAELWAEAHRHIAEDTLFLLWFIISASWASWWGAVIVRKTAPCESATASQAFNFLSHHRQRQRHGSHRYASSCFCHAGRHVSADFAACKIAQLHSLWYERKGPIRMRH
jgi:hypothetical protein